MRELVSKQELTGVMNSEGILNCDLFKIKKENKFLHIYSSCWNPSYSNIIWFVQEVDNVTKSSRVIARIHHILSKDKVVLELYDNEKLYLIN